MKQSQSQINWLFLKKYWISIGILILIVFGSNVLNLTIPRLIGIAIDDFDSGKYLASQLWIIVGLSGGVLLFSLIQTVVSNSISENIARDFRNALIMSISKQPLKFVTDEDPSQLSTLITSDTEAVKTVVSMGFVNIFSAVLILIGSIIALFSINIQLASLAILSLPLIIIVFIFVFRNISSFFRRAQEILGDINKVINESIVGSMMVRVLNSQQQEMDKFFKVSGEAREVGFNIVGLFSGLIPIINLVSNLAIVTILWFGGRQVMDGTLSTGDFSAFLSYFNLLITPIFILGFVSSAISRSFVSLQRIQRVLDAEPEHIELGTIQNEVKGTIEFRNVSFEINGTIILKHLSCTITSGEKTAIVGPTGSGKSTFISLITGLIEPTEGEILLDGIPLKEWDRSYVLQRIGVVFQDSILFNGTLLGNIIFDRTIDEDQLPRLLETAQLTDLIETLPQGLDTIVSERGVNLSGGQKQRIMLARALAINPKILILDDFTARVDIKTENDIVSKLTKNYSDLTLLSISQKISSIQGYDSIILLMQGEIVAQGTHSQLMTDSIEYFQIWQSQQSSES